MNPCCDMFSDGYSGFVINADGNNYTALLDKRLDRLARIPKEKKYLEPSKRTARNIDFVSPSMLDDLFDTLLDERLAELRHVSVKHSIKEGENSAENVGVVNNDLFRQLVPTLSFAVSLFSMLSIIVFLVNGLFVYMLPVGFLLFVSLLVGSTSRYTLKKMRAHSGELPKNL